MNDLSFNVPLAKFESEEWLDFSDQKTMYEAEVIENIKMEKSEKNYKEKIYNDIFSEKLSHSLEDLVNSFDHKVIKCLKDYKENVGNIAPMQMRSQDQIMDDCPTWWTLTGNFGPFLPIDWNKTLAKKLYLPSLNMRNDKHTFEDDASYNSSDCETEQFRKFKMHQSALNDKIGKQDAILQIETAEEVIKELNRMLKESPTTSLDSGVTPEIYSSDPMNFENDSAKYSSYIEPYLPYTKDDLESFMFDRLNQANSQLTSCIEDQSECLISELAIRDELEYEKELKNGFISLLMNIQDKKRAFIAHGKINKPLPINSPMSLINKLQNLVTLKQFNHREFSNNSVDHCNVNNDSHGLDLGIMKVGITFKNGDLVYSSEDYSKSSVSSFSSKDKNETPQNVNLDDNLIIFGDEKKSLEPATDATIGELKPVHDNFNDHISRQDINVDFASKVKCEATEFNGEDAQEEKTNQIYRAMGDEDSNFLSVLGISPHSPPSISPSLSSPISNQFKTLPSSNTHCNLKDLAKRDLSVQSSFSFNSFANSYSNGSDSGSCSSSFSSFLPLPTSSLYTSPSLVLKPFENVRQHYNVSHSFNNKGKFLTTIIPYNFEMGPPNTPILRILIKILNAINEDNDQVPGLLTDYILKVICPTD
ncbi:unnamed protein product [Gordionus sp. m RMFG-2023]|uniref:fasciculation and elongation protein zeta-1-like isoform X2 n=1 Tax=Gordionus sp. m RMFG-2023 TaxID=3053472 RepID=UPI0030E15DD8